MELADSTISSCQFFNSEINSHSLSLLLCLVSRGIKMNFPSLEEDLTKGTQKRPTHLNCWRARRIAKRRTYQTTR